MNIRERVLNSELPSKIIADMRTSGAKWQDATRDFIFAFPETGTGILPLVRKLSLGMYAHEAGSIDTIDYLILSQLAGAGLTVNVPPKPV